MYPEQSPTSSDRSHYMPEGSKIYTLYITSITITCKCCMGLWILIKYFVRSDLSVCYNYRCTCVIWTTVGHAVLLLTPCACVQPMYTCMSMYMCVYFPYRRDGGRPNRRLFCYVDSDHFQVPVEEVCVWNVDWCTWLHVCAYCCILLWGICT